MAIGSKSKSVLQRRHSIVNILQPLFDGLAIIGVAGFFIQYNVGFLTQDYIIFLLVLLGLVSVLTVTLSIELAQISVVKFSVYLMLGQ